MTGIAVLALLVAALPWAAGRSVRDVARRGTVPTASGTGSAAEDGSVMSSPVGGRTAGRERRPGTTTAGRPGHPRDPARSSAVDPALLLDLVAVALAAGAPVPTALVSVGTAWPGHAGEALVRAARALTLGASWDVAWAGGGAAALAVARALEPAWTAGASPVPLLRTAADRLRSRRRAETRAAAGRLGVQLVLPLTLCYLPAFVLVGLVPVVVSLSSSLLG
ncbi:type II secretion system F family protein [Cellulomonas sp. 73-92]|uniref:type II secretion system F family protein n=1 Tax=Cellulomonas sp. 73-92 TaxID=1895740 RepID=UPI000B1D110A|nr:type II secretion system F family protein [Cellulomonas sp. 73-92]